MNARLAQLEEWIDDRDPYLIRQVQALVSELGETQAASVLRVPLDRLQAWCKAIETPEA